MITNSGVSSDSYTCTGGTVYDITFEYLADEANLTVYHSSGADPLVLSTDYTVNTTTNEITTVETYSSGTLTILLGVEYTQLTDITSNSNYDPEVLEEAYDKVTLLAKQNEEGLSRAMTLSPIDTGTTMVLPPKAELENNYLYFDEEGEPQASPGPVPRTYVDTYSYSAGDIVQYSGDLWIARITALDVTPGTNTTYWTIYDNRATWDAEHLYVENDITSYMGVLVKAGSGANNIGQTPDIDPGGADAYWSVVETGGAIDVDGELADTTDANDLVYFDTSGELAIADKGELSKCIIAGFAVSGGVDGDDIKVRSGGLLTGFAAALVPGTQYFLGDAGGICTAGSVGYNDYKVPIGVAKTDSIMDVNIGTPEYRNTQDDGNLVGSLHYFPTYEDRAGYLPTAFDNAVSQANYSELYSVVGDIYEEMHTDAGDAASGTGMFYPTPIPGYYRRTAIPESASINSTDDVDDSTERITLTAADLKGLKYSRGVIGTGVNGVPVRVKIITGALPTGLSEGTTYFIRFISATEIELYSNADLAVAEASAINTSATTNRVNLTDATGTFRLTQEGIALDDAFQGHWHEAWATPGGGASQTALTTRTDGGAPAPAVTTYNAVRDIIADGTNGTPRTTNETRGKTVHGYEYIKACYVTPAGEPVSALRYDTGWILRDEGTPADNWQDAELCVTHGLDGKEELIVKFFLKTAGGSIVEIGQSQRSTSTSNYGYIIKYVDDNNLYIETGADGLLYVSASSGGSVSVLDTQDDWYYKVVVMKPALVATYAPVPANYSYDIASSDTIHALPTAVGYTGEITVFWTGGDGSNDITFTTVGSQTIDGLAASVWVGEGEGLITLVSDNSNWLVKEYRDSGTGWKKEADGGMKQWGTQAVSSSSQTVTFSKTFISAAIQVVANHETAARMVAVVALATTNCILNVSAYDGSNDTSGSDAYWTAKGRWRT
ncbi:MAG: hypothetical protein DRN81_05120 [Thermoproteota archaeon]|nr:MAG: hypothetical protein DRN81_05120 [Candidatus Korarchaeota archaeon]